MKITRANVEEYAKSKGLEPVQIDGIPEGFSFKQSDITIAGKTHLGPYLAFIPLANWEDERHYVSRFDPENLLKAYKELNGK